jgi:hypothetical protein
MLISFLSTRIISLWKATRVNCRPWAPGFGKSPTILPITSPSTAIFPRKINHLTFYSKSHRNVKAIIWYLLTNISPQDITQALQELAIDVINFKQMTTKLPSPESPVVTVCSLWHWRTARSDKKFSSSLTLPTFSSKVKPIGPKQVWRSGSTVISSKMSLVRGFPSSQRVPGEKMRVGTVPTVP